jgi:ferredoxin
MSTEIYYFSGTGNSLYVAEELQKLIPGASLIPIVRLLSKDVIETDGEIVGFVFPVHLTTAPIPVKLFFRKLELKSAGYIFALATRGGTTHRAFIDIKKLLRKKGKKLDSYFTLNMFNNNMTVENNWVPPTVEEIAKMESVVQDKLESIQKIIKNREKRREKDTQVVSPLPSVLIRLIPLLMVFLDVLGPRESFYSDSKCTGCGICEKVCLSRKIKMINNRPLWQKNVRCFMCRACLNYCPEQSVQIKSTYTDRNGRYSHPYATAGDIAQQK